MKEEWSGDRAIGHLWIGREDVQWPSIFDIIRYGGSALSCSGRIFVYAMQPHPTPSFTCDVLERKLTRSPWLRMTSPKYALTSTSVPQRWFPRADGWCLDTRYEIFHPPPPNYFRFDSC